jgi:hypothetical protein
MNQRAKTEDKQGSSETFQKNGDREDQAAESFCKSHTHQEVPKAKAISQDGDSSS